MSHPRRAFTLTLAGLLAGTALAGCGSGGDDSGGTTPSVVPTGVGPSGSATDGAVGSGAAVPSGYPSQAATITGLSLTAPGKALRVGQSATVAWQPSQKTVGALDVTVTAMHSTTFKQSFKGWELDAATRGDAPYFVTASVRNAGQADLGGRAVPLYGAAASGALVEASTFASDFKPCHPGVLPTPFPAGARADVCLVYLVPDGGALDGVSFRPTERFDPITWTGEVTPLPKGGSKAGTTSGSGAASTAPSVPLSPTGTLKPHVSVSPAR